MLRLPRLAQRPMHGDEAIHAVRFGRLLEQGVYTYDPNEYHGPTLNYLSLVPAWLSSAKKLTQVTEFTVRVVPVLFGLLLIPLVFVVVGGLGRTPAVCAAALTAVSPAMVFYSRYYIMEILLICFTFSAIVCGYRYVQSRKILWAILTGVSLGLMHATKETCIIAFGSMLAAILLVLLVPQHDRLRRNFEFLPLWHIIVGLAAAAVVSALFYSSFFSNPKGILDSFQAYATYFSRAGHNSLHIHPWHYYLKMLLYFRYGTGPAWSEASIVILAVAGFVVAMTPAASLLRSKTTGAANSALLKFIAFYTLTMTTVYSAVPYKTPWCMLGFLHGMIILAGVGAGAMIELVPNVSARRAVILLVAASGAHLGWQAYLTNYVYYADSRNPYVYAHPTTEVFTVARLVEQIARVHPDGHAMHIQVICPGDDYWPLPWYLRFFTRVEYRDSVDANAAPIYIMPQFLLTKEETSLREIGAAPVIIASASLEAAIADKLYEQTPFQQRQMYMYMFDKPYYVWLRPKVKLIGLVRKDIWQLWQHQQD